MKLVDKVENKSNILHCLATISALKGILIVHLNIVTNCALDENDAVAHLQLGYHYYSNTEDDEK